MKQYLSLYQWMWVSSTYSKGGEGRRERRAKGRGREEEREGERGRNGSLTSVGHPLDKLVLSPLDEVLEDVLFAGLYTETIIRSHGR